MCGPFVSRASDDSKMMVETTLNAPVLLYDGVCGFCNKTVQMILERDRRGTMRFAALQSDYGRAVVERHASLRGVDSVVFVENANGGGGGRGVVRPGNGREACEERG